MLFKIVSNASKVPRDSAIGQVGQRDERLTERPIKKPADICNFKTDI
jgi:hypothetical protein